MSHFTQLPVTVSRIQPGLQLHWPKLNAALDLHDEHEFVVAPVQVRHVLSQDVQANVTVSR